MADHDLHKDGSPTCNPDAAGVLFQKGALLFRAGRPAQALAVFDTLASAAPGGARLCHARGLCHHALGDIAGAVAGFDAAVRLKPDFLNAWRSIADVTPSETQRRNALRQAARITRKQCDGTRATPDRVMRCVDALLAARRPHDAARIAGQHRGRFSEASDWHRLAARAAYHGGRYRQAHFHIARALARFAPETCQTRRPAPAFDAGRAAGVLADMTSLFAAQGLQVFPVAGTLLGLWRSGGPLAHDRDVDIGIFNPPGAAVDIAAILRVHRQLQLPRMARPGDRYFGMTYKGTAIDIFVHDRAGRAVLCGFSGNRGDIQWRLSPFSLAQVRLNGRIWTLPDKPERYLEEWYGPGWQVADPNFASVVSSPALFETDRFARAYFAVARAIKALQQGDRIKAAALLRQSPVDRQNMPRSGPGAHDPLTDEAS